MTLLPGSRIVANAREVNGQLVYKVRVRDTGSGKSITIPVDVCRYLGIEIGDTMVIVLLDDGFTVSKGEEEQEGAKKNEETKTR